MSEDRKENTSARQRRVRRLKRMIVATVILVPSVLFVCCVILLCRVYELNHRVDALTGKLVAMEWEKRLARMVPHTGPEDVHTLSSSEEGFITDEQFAHRVYLTFDDGPSANTDEILDILAEYDVKATFFVVGKEDEKSKAAIERIVAEGHTLGMHSYSHKYSDLYSSKESFVEDFEKQRSVLQELTGESCRFYRFPGGSSNTVSKVDMSELASYLKEQGVSYFDWNISSGDASRERLSVDTLVKNSTQDIERYSDAVILLHDSAEKKSTVEALPQIIEKIQGMEDTVILPISNDTKPIRHLE